MEKVVQRLSGGWGWMRHNMVGITTSTEFSPSLEYGEKSLVTGVPSFQYASTCRNVLYRIIFAQDRIFTDGHKESDLRDECKATFLGQMD